MQRSTRLSLLLLLLLALTVFNQVSALPVDDQNVATSGQDSSVSSASNTSDKQNLVARDKDDYTTTITTKATATASSKPRKTPNSKSGEQDSVYGSAQITPQMGVTGALLIVLGLYLMVLGFKYFQGTLAVCGFIAFGFIAWVGMANTRPASGFVNDSVTSIVVPIGVGIAGAILFAVLGKFAVYPSTALSGLALALFICCWRENFVIVHPVGRACFLAGMVLFFGGLAFLHADYVVLFATSFVGAYVFIVGIDFFARTGYLTGISCIVDHNPLHSYTYSINTKVYVMLAITLFVFLVSFGWQFLHSKGKSFIPGAPAGNKDEEKAAEPENGGGE